MQFAEWARGQVTVMVDGSRLDKPAYRRDRWVDITDGSTHCQDNDTRMGHGHDHVGGDHGNDDDDDDDDELMIKNGVDDRLTNQHEGDDHDSGADDDKDDDDN